MLEASEKPSKVCAIGASAGGLAPVEEFFGAMPNDTGMAFVLVQHLSPDHESMMAQLLASHTDMPINVALDNMAIASDHVYLIPPGTELSIHDGRLRVRRRELDRRHLHRPIDVFFVAMAREYRQNSVAVILSGTGSDGTAGIEQVARAGGLALVQDDSAAFEGMPDAAVRSGFVDAVLAPAQLASTVADFARSAARPEQTTERRGLDPLETLIMADLERLSGINFSEYKPGTLKRRLERRVVSLDTSLDDYSEMIRVNKEERLTLIHELLIDVTNFFRDTELFDELARHTIPRLVDEAIKNKAPIRVWSAGCATGEEPYSIAMLILEELRHHKEWTPDIQIFATDVHTGALETAGAGRYSDEGMAGVSYARRQEFFERTDQGWQVKPEVRNLITFAQHNILSDAPFTRVDLVTCRNLLIYFRRPAQDRAIAAMAFALRLGGVLVLGPSEALGIAEPDFASLNSTWRVSEKIGESMRRAYRPATAVRPRTALPKRSSFSSIDQKLRQAYDIVLESQFTGGLLINESGELVHSIGAATGWLKQPAGRPTLEALAMIGDANLRLSMGTTLRELETGALEARPRQVIPEPRETDGSNDAMMLCGRRLKVGNEQLFVLFTRPIERAISAAASEGPLTLPSSDTAYVEQLEAELGYVRETLQSAIEEQESSNEELNAANEELIASNEELQSTNEELSSVNEELRTLNDEHRRQLDQVLDLSADLEQLMSSTDIGVVFLAEDRSIRRFNEPARDYFRVRDSDVGRPFDDVMTLLDTTDLAADIATAFESGEGRSRPVKLRDQPGRHLLVKVDRYELPRRRWGVFVAVVDISQATIADQEKLLARYLRAAPVNVEIWDRENVCIYANQHSEVLAAGEFEPGRTIGEIFAAETAATIEAENARVIAEGPITVFRSANSKLDAPEYMFSKFPIEVDGRPHVGSIALRVDEVDGLTGLREERQLLEQIVAAGLVRCWPVRADIDAAEIIEDKWISLSASADLTEAQLERIADEDEPTLVAMKGETQEFGQSYALHRVNVDEHLGALVALNVDKPRRELVAARDDVARLEMELAETVASGAKDTSELAERNLDLDNFAHVAAHDLKAPIRSVRSFSEMAMAEIPNTSPAAEHLHQVIEASRRMGDLVESLLDFASIDREAPTRETIDLRGVIEDVQIDLGSTIDANGAEVLLLDELPLVEGNPNALRQVLSNLIGNAIKYRAEANPRIEISATTNDDGVTLVVSDNGLGFHPDQADRMFEPFQRLHATSVSGSGVGLAICRRIVQRHHGRIWATGEPGVGARFSVWLPIRLPADDLELLNTRAKSERQGST